MRAPVQQPQDTGDLPRGRGELLSFPSNTPGPRPRSLLALWHLLSLDAPTVAAVWTWFVAHSFRVEVPWTSSVAMFLAVWLLYAADRLLDAVPRSGQNHARELEERHRFHARHGRGFLLVMAITSAAMSVLLFHLSPAALRLYAVLGSLLCAYFILIHRPPAAVRPSRLPKELAVGVFFPAAVFIPTVARAPALRLDLLPCALLLAAVCTLNCLYIYLWEHPRPRTSAHWTTRAAVSHLPALTFAAAFSCVALALGAQRFAAASQISAVHAITAACALSCIAFLALHATRRRVRTTDLRAAVDLALLTPLLVTLLTKVLAP